MSKTKTKSNKKKITIVITLLLAIIIAVVVGVLSNSQTDVRKTNFIFDKEIAKGIDVSYHNGKINWKKASEEIDFAFVRVGYRGFGNAEIGLDKQFKRNMKKADENNVPVGVYFYSQATTVEEAEEEAEFALKAIKGYNVSLPVFIDFEFANLKTGKLGGRLYDAGLSKKDSAKIINAFCSKVEKAGYQAGCYTNTYFYNSIIETSKLNKTIFIWVADYNKDITYKGDYDIWQYSQNGKCAGIKSQYVDLNYWYTKK